MQQQREHALHVVLAVVAALCLSVAFLAQTLSGTARGLLDVPVSSLPLGLLLLLAVPATVWLCGRALVLSTLGGAVTVAPDSAVLGFLLWAGAGAAAAAPGLGPRWGQDPATLLALCGWVWLVWLAGVAWSEAAARGRRGWVRASNVGLSAIAGAAFLAAAAAVRAVTATALGHDALTASLGPWDAAAALAGAGAYAAVDLLLTAVSVALGEGGRVRDALADESTVVAVAAVVTLASLAVVGAGLLIVQPWALLLLAPVAVTVNHAAGVGARASAESARSAALYEAAEQCQRAETDAQVLQALVAGAGRVAAAPAVLSDHAPGSGQIGGCLSGLDGERWLVCGPRGAGHPFVPGDERTLTTLARLGTESLARVAGVAAMRELAARDTLTGIANRATLTAALREQLATAHGPTALLFGDLDGFKAVNDAHGHLAGDELLTTVARRLAASVRPQDLVARLGGDEFAVLLPATDAASAADLARRLMAAVGTPARIGDRLVDVSMSLGCAATDDLPPNDDPGSSTVDDRLVDAADQAMYRVKRAARSARGEPSPTVDATLSA